AARQLLGLIEHDSGATLTNLLRHPRFSDYLENGDFEQPLRLPEPVSGAILQYRVTALEAEGLLLRVEDVSRVARLENMRRDFVANVSHELKTPITVFKGSLELLMEQMPETDKPHLARLLDNMSLQSDRMDALVRGLLLLSRLEGTPANRQDTVSLDALLDELATTFNAQAAAHQQPVDCDVTAGLATIGHADELASAFSNLIDNALSHTPEGGHVSVHCHPDNDGIRFAVGDNGPGIEDKHLPYLTERFYRVDDSRSTAS